MDCGDFFPTELELISQKCVSVKFGPERCKAACISVLRTFVYIKAICQVEKYLLIPRRGAGEVEINPHLSFFPHITKKRLGEKPPSFFSSFILVSFTTLVRFPVPGQVRSPDKSIEVLQVRLKPPLGPAVFERWF